MRYGDSTQTANDEGYDVWGFEGRSSALSRDPTAWMSTYDLECDIAEDISSYNKLACDEEGEW